METDNAGQRVADEQNGAGPSHVGTGAAAMALKQEPGLHHTDAFEAVEGAAHAKRKSRDLSVLSTSSSTDAAASVHDAAEQTQPKKKQKRKAAHTAASSSKTAAARTKAEADRSEEQEQDAGEEDESDTKLYCICNSLYDEERMMIACDRCDEWYHAVCMSVNEAEAELVDMFICPKCAPETSQRTTWKVKCMRAGCTHAAQLPLSRYCSQRCGITAAMERINQAKQAKFHGSTTNGASAATSSAAAAKKTQQLEKAWLDKLLHTPGIVSAEKREGLVVWAREMTLEQQSGWLRTILGNEVSDTVYPSIVQATLQEARKESGAQRRDDDLVPVLPQLETLCRLQMQLDRTQQERATVNRRLDILSARTKLLLLAEDRTAVLEPIRSQETVASSSKSSAKKAKSKKAKGAAPATEPNSENGASAPSAPSVATREEPRCGYDERLHWDDARFAEWATGETGKAMLDAKTALDGRLSDAAKPETDAGESGAPAPPDDAADVAPAICGQSKRKCKSHVDWSRVREVDFDVQKEQQTQKLQTLSDEAQRVTFQIAKVRRDVQKALSAQSERTKQLDERMAFEMENQGKRKATVARVV